MSDSRPTFFYRMFQIAAVIGFIPFAAITLDIIRHPLLSPLDGTPASRVVGGLLIAPLTLAIGILCVRRARGNVIGWMLIVFSYGSSIQAIRAGWLPIVPTVVAGNMMISFFWLSYILIPLYFPDGRLYTPRMNRWGNLILTLIMILLFASGAIFNRTISWGSDNNITIIDNPLFVADFDLARVSVPLIILLLILGAISLILRYRGGNIRERLQLRWLLVGVALQFGLLAFSTILADLLQISSELLGVMYSAIIPIAIGNALLRHRLYDIDIIIRRTLTYSAITALLAGSYFGAVTLLQSLSARFVGGESPLAIVASTLLIAALFTPIRRRVQAFVDQRFYRRKYDMARTLETFGDVARDEVDLAQIQASLVRVVDETMQPEHVSLWLSEQSPRGGRL